MLLDILYEDDELVAINKPAGLFVHRTQLDPELVVALQLLRDQIGQRVYPLHRIDRPTSGVLLFAKDQVSTRTLNMGWQENVVKQYFAVCRGYTDASGEIDYPVENASGRQKQSAQTQYTTCATVEVPEPVGRYTTSRYSLVKVTPLTGRMHQIRRHFKHIFHPLLGDTTYGDGKQNTFLREFTGIDRLFLHAATLTLRHPVSEKKLSIAAPLDANWQQLFHYFNWQNLPSLDFTCTPPMLAAQLPLFVYGTLCHKAIFAEIVKRSPEFLSATLPGFRAVGVVGAKYPAAIMANESQLNGLLCPVSAAELAILDGYEGNEYVRVAKHVILADGRKHLAWVYQWQSELGRLDVAEWQLTDFMKNDADSYLARLKNES